MNREDLICALQGHRAIYSQDGVYRCTNCNRPFDLEKILSGEINIWVQSWSKPPWVKDNE